VGNPAEKKDGDAAPSPAQRHSCVQARKRACEYFVLCCGVVVWPRRWLRTRSGLNSAAGLLAALWTGTRQPSHSHSIPPAPWRTALAAPFLPSALRSLLCSALLCSALCPPQPTTKRNTQSKGATTTTTTAYQSEMDALSPMSMVQSDFIPCETPCESRSLKNRPRRYACVRKSCPRCRARRLITGPHSQRAPSKVASACARSDCPACRLELKELGGATRAIRCSGPLISASCNPGTAVQTDRREDRRGCRACQAPGRAALGAAYVATT
jgi:hypothetical protein